MGSTTVVAGGNREDANRNRGSVSRDDSRTHSQGTENVLRAKYDSEVKKNPGLSRSIAGKFRKF